MKSVIQCHCKSVLSLWALVFSASWSFVAKNAYAQVVIQNESQILKLSPKGGCLDSVVLPDFPQEHSKSQPVDLLERHQLCKSLGIKMGDQDLRNQPATVTKESETVVVAQQESQGLKISKRWEMGSKYVGRFLITIENTTAQNYTGSLKIELPTQSEWKESTGFLAKKNMGFREFVWQTEGSLTRESLPFKDTPENGVVVQKQLPQLDWVGAGDIYFTTGLVPKVTTGWAVSLLRTGYNIQKNATSPANQTIYEGWLERPLSIPPQGSETIEFQTYFGPKKHDDLLALSQVKFEHIVDFGFFKVIAWPIFYALKFLNSVFNNWGWAIIVLTILVKFLFYPLQLKSYLASKKMQKIQPELNAIKEKFKDDKQAQQRETMAVMAQRGVNPMTGCLPILPTIPVFFGLVAVLQHAFELRMAPFGLWIQDLSDRDPYYVLPVLMTVLMYLQQHLVPMPTVDPSQQRMLKLMPLVFSLFMLAYPSGMSLYVIMNTVIQILQQQYMMRKYKDA